VSAESADPVEVGHAHFAGFVLCDFVLCVLLAALTLAVGATSLGNVDLGIAVC
jgi:hypothetical protein